MGTSAGDGAGASPERRSGGRGSDANRQPAGDAPHESGAGLEDGDGDCVPVGDCVEVTVAVAEALAGDELALTVVLGVSDIVCDG